MSGVNGIAAAIAELATVNATQQTTTAFWLIVLLNCYVPLTEAFTKELTEAEQAYFAATLSINEKNPQNAALAAADYQAYTQIGAEMDKELAGQNELMQNGKTQLRAEGNANDNLYSIEQPLTELLKSIVGIILQFIQS